MTKLKYAIHPGHIPSMNDSDVHFINYRQLIELYQLDPAECWLVQDLIATNNLTESQQAYANQLGLIHLTPRYSGDYLEHLERVINEPKTQ